MVSDMDSSRCYVRPRLSGYCGGRGDGPPVCRARSEVPWLRNHAPAAPPHDIAAPVNRKPALPDQAPQRIGDDLRIPVDLRAPRGRTRPDCGTDIPARPARRRKAVMRAAAKIGRSSRAPARRHASDGRRPGCRTGSARSIGPCNLRRSWPRPDPPPGPGFWPTASNRPDRKAPRPGAGQVASNRRNRRDRPRAHAGPPADRGEGRRRELQRLAGRRHRYLPPIAGGPRTKNPRPISRPPSQAKDRPPRRPPRSRAPATAFHFEAVPFPCRNRP